MRRVLRFLLCLIASAGCSPAPSIGAGDIGAESSVPSTAPTRCSMGFAELFWLAKGREWTEEEVRGFQALDQEGKNQVVKQLAAEAGCVRTEDQIGIDGVVYTAFWRE